MSDTCINFVDSAYAGSFADCLSDHGKRPGLITAEGTVSFGKVVGRKVRGKASQPSK